MSRLTAILLACSASFAHSAAPGGSLCGFDGSVPGSAATTIAVGAGDTYYVEDRDYLDADGDRVAGGLWVYRESNGRPGLQRGGPTQVLGWVDPCQDAGTPDTGLAGIPYGRGSSSTCCCQFDGSVPGTPAHVYVFGADPVVLYVDDRDYADLDEDGVAGGIWVYLESNGQPGLQRGGAGVLEAVPVTTPWIPSTTIIPPDPNRPVLSGGFTLFPAGFGGQSLARTTGSVDSCVESLTPDQLVW